MSETVPTLEPQSFQQPQLLEHIPAVPPTEIRSPRLATFGAIAVQEDLNAQLLTPHEQNLYRSGFEILKTIVNAADNNIARMVLTNPEMTSGIVGHQPLISMYTGEAVLLYQAFRKANIDFNQNYSFLEFGKERQYMKLVIHDKAAENVLRTYQNNLGINLPQRQLGKDEILTHIIQLMNSTDVKRANLAHGLLSGFPLEDCKDWVEGTSGTVYPIPTLEKAGDVDNRFARVHPISLLNPDDYDMSTSRNHYLPDTRSSVTQDSRNIGIRGFGVAWASKYPPSKATIDHAQRLLQMDREIGLLDFVNKQRSTFNIEDNRKAIAVQRELLNKSPYERFGRIGAPIGLVFGIFSLFSSLLTDVITEQIKPEQEKKE